MPSVPFPRSSTPGQLPGEGEGRLINAFVENAGDTVEVRRVPGLGLITGMGQPTPRGMTDVAGDLFAAYAGYVIRLPAGQPPAIIGSLPGTDAVTWAKNNKAPTPDMFVVRTSGGAFYVTPSSVTDMSATESDLPATVNSGASMGNYGLFTIPDGRIFATELGETAIEALSFGTAEARPDGLLRGVVHGAKFLAMGSSSIEPWLNTGLSPFPLQPGPSVIQAGLLAPMAVAGFEEGWDGNLLFAAHDGSVRELRGYDAVKVSTAAVERFIASSTSSTLEALVYTFRGHSIWSLSSDAGTWEFNVTTRLWHERASVGAVGWRGSRSVKSGGRWLVGDKLSTDLLSVGEAYNAERDQALTWTVESAPLKEFPARFTIPDLFLDFARSEGVSVVVSWSHDAGVTWRGPLTRSLAAVHRSAARINNLGLTNHTGFRLRLTISDAVDFTFLGAAIPNPQPRTP